MQRTATNPSIAPETVKSEVARGKDSELFDVPLLGEFVDELLHHRRDVQGTVLVRHLGEETFREIDLLESARQGREGLGEEEERVQRRERREKHGTDEVDNTLSKREKVSL
jgi:hypothetical protein